MCGKKKTAGPYTSKSSQNLDPTKTSHTRILAILQTHGPRYLGLSGLPFFSADSDGSARWCAHDTHAGSKLSYAHWSSLPPSIRWRVQVLQEAQVGSADKAEDG